MPYSPNIGYCRIDLERFRNGSRSFVSNTITPQTAKFNIQHTTYIIITVQSIISTGFGKCHTHFILVIVALTLSASAMARAPSSPIPLPHKLQNMTCNIQQTTYIIITVQSIIFTGFGKCHTHSILVIVALTLSASAMARAPSSPIPLPHKLQNLTYNIQHTSLSRSRVSYPQDSVNAILTLYLLLSH
jgi:hypothetical protein